MDKTEFIGELHSRLIGHYGVPSPKPVLPPLDELVKTILSQNTTDKNSYRAFAALKDAFSSWEQLLEAPDGDVIELIRTGGLAKTKTGYIKGVLADVWERNGKLDLNFLNDILDEEALAFLTGLPGVGAKTAHCVLAFSLGRDVFPVDTHVLRLSRRWKLIPPKTDMSAAHKLWAEMAPPGQSYPLHMNIIRHGREICHARNPECEKCFLNDVCPEVTNE
ncbi:MAG: endonuclease III [bacterium]|nr:endonuclease III [bacterium]